MKLYKCLIIVLTTGILIQSLTVLSQDWDNISDSTYNEILLNRFNKGNVLVGLGGSFRMDNDYKVIEFGIRQQAGYFIANRWLLNTGIDYYYGHAKQDAGKATLNRFLFGAGIRRYLKPKHRTIFIEVGPIVGNVKEHATSIPGFNSYNYTVYGGKAIIGLSVFIRRFELELSVGIKVYSPDYKSENLFSSEILQLNLSYIFDRHKRSSNN